MAEQGLDEAEVIGNDSENVSVVKTFQQERVINPVVPMLEHADTGFLNILKARLEKNNDFNSLSYQAVTQLLNSPEN